MLGAEHVSTVAGKSVPRDVQISATEYEGVIILKA